MIDQNEIRRMAGKLGVSPMVVDHDYVLGCTLHYLYIHNYVKKHWLFKGGTALAKCHFVKYRFSDDLDFTITKRATEESLLQIVDTTKKIMQDEIGIETMFLPTKVTGIKDEYGEESFEAKFYYRGPWYYRGSPRSVRIHINRGETIIFPIRDLALFHDYSDRDLLPVSSATVYSLEEIYVEKLRALSAQRQYAIARDLFDLYHLSLKDIDTSSLKTAFQKKCAVKNIRSSALDYNKILQQKENFEINWNTNLEHIVPKELKIPFDYAWSMYCKQLSVLLSI